MKKLILSVMILAMVAVSCKKNKESATTETSESSSQLYSCPMHPEVTGKQGEACSECGMELTEPVAHTEATHEHHDGDMHEGSNMETTNSTSQSSFSINEIVSGYLNLKNALVKDDSKGAAAAGKALQATFGKVNSNEIDAKLKKQYLDIADDAKEHAEHIADNSGKIDRQREHFVMLSKDINDLITAFGTKQKLYQDFCPMADNDKGAIWISETKDIKNPYFGSQMLSCGAVKKEW
ncbi:DUF3347 domain-containing protein [Flavobacterium sp. K5-23]|uniref:DUF3347 domain-containing protein n=1 Tax=Flavobacterium sp. K5-23 TaxID=2746225 RepID=UPI00200D5709|nr:DUF3347 domain-containing protein [Flavobacterium sp. K5-23]UQD55155.1 DUF3347 domain-containing protein [Flavobacterium sp. K5-23]